MYASLSYLPRAAQPRGARRLGTVVADPTIGTDAAVGTLAGTAVLADEGAHGRHGADGVIPCIRHIQKHLPSTRQSSRETIVDRTYGIHKNLYGRPQLIGPMVYIKNYLFHHFY